MKKGGLGKGLDAIFAENTEDNSGTVSVRIDEIEPNRNQPRKDFDEAALNDLADSIAQHGIIQPLLVRPIFSGGYQIVAGERRWRAARMAGLKEVPVIIREMDDAEFMEISLIENLQREDLTPLEEAKGYASLMETHGFTQEDVSKAVGKSRPVIANALRLLNLPEEIQELIEKGDLTAGHGRTLLAFKNKEDMLRAAERIVNDGISVRELEKMVKACNERKDQEEKPAKPQNHYYEEVRLALNEHLGRKVKISGTKKKGVIQIEFYGEDDLKALMTELNKD